MISLSVYLNLMYLNTLLDPYPEKKGLPPPPQFKNKQYFLHDFLGKPHFFFIIIMAVPF